MRPISVLCVAIILIDFADPALAAQGPGTSVGTAGPLAQWFAALCGIGFASLGVVFSQWDDGHYADF